MHVRKTKMPEDSISFVPLLTRSVRSARHYAYVEHFGPEAMTGPASVSQPDRQAAGGRGVSRSSAFAIRDARWKYMEEKTGGQSLFDLAKDPLEQVNLLVGAKATGAEAQAALETLKRQLKTMRGKK